MTRRNAGPLFEGKDRREVERRKADRRKSARIMLVLKYLVVAVVAAILVKILTW
jgi:hypothetical protein